MAIGIVRRPDVLFLDEPTAGFDPKAHSEFHKLVHRLAAEQNTTILLTTHDLTETNKLTHQILILATDRIIASSNIPELTQLIAAEDEVGWTVNEQRFRRSTPDSTAFVHDLFATYGDALGELEIHQTSLKNTYLTLIQKQQ